MCHSGRVNMEQEMTGPPAAALESTTQWAEVQLQAKMTLQIITHNQWYSPTDTHNRAAETVTKGWGWNAKWNLDNTGRVQTKGKRLSSNNQWWWHKVQMEKLTLNNTKVYKNTRQTKVCKIQKDALKWKRELCISSLWFHCHVFVFVLQHPSCSTAAALCPTICVTHKLWQMLTWFPAELWLLLVWLLLCCALWWTSNTAALTGKTRGEQGKHRRRQDDRDKSTLSNLICLIIHFSIIVKPSKLQSLLSKANEVLVVSVDIGELDVNQQKNLKNTKHFMRSRNMTFDFETDATHTSAH